MQSALYRIAETASAAQDMPTFYAKIHEIVGELMYADNFYIALYDEARRLINFPYSRDEVDTDLPDPNVWDPFGVGEARGATAYVLRHGRPERWNTATFETLAEKGEIEILGQPAVEWLGAPLKADGRTVGVIAVQTYREDRRYAREDLDLLVFVAQHVGSALVRARAIEETRQRNAELAIVNEIGTALARQLDFQAIVELVGQRLGEILSADDLFIAFVDASRAQISVPYIVQGGERRESIEFAMGEGLTSQVLAAKQPMRFGTIDEQMPFNPMFSPSIDIHESWLGVPIMAGDQAIGVVNVSSHERNAYTDGDERLVATVASSMGVALENARLFDETKRLLTETDARAAELSLINEVQRGLAEKLDMQAMYDLVGDKIQEIFDAQGVDIEIYDKVTGLIHFPYSLERGKRLFDEPMELFGIRRHVYESKAPLLINRDLEQEAAKYGQPATLAGELAKSVIFVPLISGGDVRGFLLLENLDREDAFTDAEVRLLSTLASSLSVALENARLFDETKNLLAETDERAAELAIINEIGAALAKQLDFQAIVDLVGERISQILSADTVAIAILAPGSDTVTFPYSLEAGVRQMDSPDLPLGEGLTSRVIQSNRPVRVGTSEDAEALGVVWVGDRMESFLGVPIPAGDRVLGAIDLAAFEPHAYSEADERLLSTLASSMGVALENARLFDETKRLLSETDARVRELAVINEIGAALAKQLDFGAIIELVGERLRTMLASDDMFIALLDAQRNQVTFPYMIDTGLRVHGNAIQLGEGLTSLVLQEGAPRRFGSRADQIAHGAIFLKLSEGGTATIGESWLGVPITAGGETIGALVFADARVDAFTDSDERVVSTIASGMGVALENARLFDETKRLLSETEQRNAELAVVNEIGAALAKQLDFAGIIEVVGDQLATTLRTQDIYIGLYDRSTNMISFPYELDHGRRLHGEPIELGLGLTSAVIQSAKPLRFGSFADQQAHGGFMGDYEEGEASQPGESWLGVPILAGKEPIGVVVIGDDRPNAFSESDERLVNTIASSMGVALENARLFGETRRLLAETDERAAELAIITSVQEGLAQNLDMQSMYDLVGDKIQEIFDAQVVDIGIYDREADLFHFPYGIERGVRFPDEPIQLRTGPAVGSSTVGVRLHVMETRRPFLANSMEDLGQFGDTTPLVGEAAKSALWAPLVVGDETRGVISLQNLDRESVFAESDVRLLTTLASSLSVALENARLFDETKRLLAETDERAAELQIINSVQQGLAANLDMQAMYDLVGDKIQEIFDTQVVDIAMIDRRADEMRFVYGRERGIRLEEVRMPLIGPRRQVVESREPLLINEHLVDKVAGLGQSGPIVGEQAKSALWAPLIVGDEARGVISLQNLDRENAFIESDIRILTTLASSLSVALENARLFEETKRLLAETDERAAELAILNSVQHGLSAQLDMQAMYDLVGGKIQEIFDAQVVDIGIFDFAAGLTHYPYTIERGVRFPDAATRIQDSSLNQELLRTGQPILITDVNAWESERGVVAQVIQGEPALSVLFAPLTSGGEVRGRISLQNLDRTDAFTEGDVRVLSTLAASLSVALDNARLFDETKRLLAETDARAAELAIINSVQEGLAQNLDMQAMYDLVGDEIQEIFDAQTVVIMTYDLDAGTQVAPYFVHTGERLFRLGRSTTAQRHRAASDRHSAADRYQARLDSVDR